MALYEIYIPPEGGERSPRVERVHGENWLEALRRGLATAGRPAPARNLGFELQDDGTVVVNDADAGRAYHVVPVSTPKPRRLATPAPYPATPAPVAAPEPDRGDDLEDPFAGEDDLDTAVAPMALPARGRARPSGETAVVRERPTARRPGVLETVDYEEAGMLESQEMPALRPSDLPGAADSDERHPLMQELDALRRFPADVYGACAYVLDALRAHIACEAGSALLIDARDRCLYFAVARGPNVAGLTTQRVPLEVGLAGACIRGRRVVNIIDPAHDPRFARSIADAVGHVPRSILAAPITSGARAFGVVELLDRTGRRGFSEEDEELTRRAGRRLGDFFAALLPGR